MGATDSFKRGTVELVLLALLSERDMYGYELTQELRRRSEQKYSLLEGSMYPILYRMQEKGYISDRKEQVGTRKTVVYYHLEPLGEEQFQVLQQEYRRLTDGVFRILDSVQGEC